MNHPLWKSLHCNVGTHELLDLFKDEPYLFALDSSQYEPQRGRFSFVGFDPFDTFISNDRLALEQLQKKFLPYFNRNVPLSTPFPGGVMGYLSYDYGLKQEGIVLKDKECLNVPEVLFGFYDCVITIDHLLKKIIVVSTGWPEKQPYLRLKRAQQRLDKVVTKLSRLNLNRPSVLTRPEKVGWEEGSVDLVSNFTQEGYVQAVRKVLGHIAQGEAYQINLSQRFELKLNQGSSDPFELYRRLRECSPTCFSSFFKCGDFSILSSSPERFLLLKENLVQARPMKGTRPRGRTEKEDHHFRQEIIQSEKDRAELLMITDLMRNDLGRVCDFGTIRVKNLRNVEEYQNVFQTTSTIEGRLKRNSHAFDLLRATFPSGSITGCPKIRAMQLIEDLEPVRRSIYTGSLGYIAFSGNMDFSVLIRSMLYLPDKVYFHVGGGIVADSVPADEYQETLAKALGIRRSLQRFITDRQPVLNS